MTSASSAPSQDPAEVQLALSGVRVEFGATLALDDISFSVRSGEIVGLLGHNGAGKSTLFNVVSGALAASAGSVTVGQTEAPVRPTPSEMAKLGITVIHQEPALAHNLTVLDNIFLGQEHLITAGRGESQAQAALDQVGARIDLYREVASLGLGERQLVDLARGLVRGRMRVLMLDEPTAALGKAETDTLHRLIRQLAAEGTTIVYVSHRLPDILDVCTRIIILRAGRLQSDGPAAEFDGPSLAQALAPEIERGEFAERQVGKEAALSVGGVFAGIEAARGEVIGLFGMAAGRQFELLEQIFGLRGKYQYEVGGVPVTVSSPKAAMRRGVHLVPADRERDGLISGQSAIDAVFLPWFSTIPGKGKWINPNTGRDAYQRAREALHVVGPEGSAPIDEFSGGNRQKHLIARWAFVRRPEVLLLAQPTQGVDVGARVDIARAVHAIAAEGTTVLVASSESDEIDLLCDRAFVIADTKFTQVERTAGFGEALLTTLLSLAETSEKVSSHES